MGLALFWRPLLRLWEAMHGRAAAEEPPTGDQAPPEAEAREPVVILPAVPAAQGLLLETGPSVHTLEPLPAHARLPAPANDAPLAARRPAPALAPRCEPDAPAPEPRQAADSGPPVRRDLRPRAAAATRADAGARWIKPAPTDGLRGSWDSGRGLWFTGRWTASQP